MAVDLQMPLLIVDDYKTMLRIIRNLLKQPWDSVLPTSTRPWTGARR